MIPAMANALISAQADQLCGAEYGERSPERTNRRNGYRAREWDSRAGTVELAVPKLAMPGVKSGLQSALKHRRSVAERRLPGVIGVMGPGSSHARTLMGGDSRWVSTRFIRGLEKRPRGRCRASDEVYPSQLRRRGRPLVDQSVAQFRRPGDLRQPRLRSVARDGCARGRGRSRRR
jgi:Transposase, Mutator family